LDTLLNKFFFRKYYKKIPYYHFNKKISDYDFPILLKKKISSGGKNIYKINNANQLHKIKVKKNDYFLEKFIEGTDHGVFTIIKDKKILFSFFDNEQRFINPYTVSSTTSYTNIPLIIQKKFLKQILEIVLDLKLVDGILHLQIKYNKLEKKIYIIEITRRIPGDRYMKFVEHATDINVCSLYIDLHLNKDLLIRKNKKNKFILRKIVFAKNNGKFLKFVFSNKIKKNIIETTHIFKKNDIIKDYMNQRLAIVFVKFNSRKLLEKFTKDIDKFIKVKFV
jgi:carbamoylphosphate synthase large subunit